MSSEEDLLLGGGSKSKYGNNRTGKSKEQTFRGDKHAQKLLNVDDEKNHLDKTNVTVETEMISNYDEILPHIGGIGPWQIVMVGLLGIMAMDGGVLVLLQNFTGLEPKAFRCAVPDCDGMSAEYSDLRILPTHCSPNLENGDELNNGKICWINSQDNDANQTLNKNSNTETVSLDKYYMCYKPIFNLSFPQQQNKNYGTPRSEILEVQSNCSFITTEDVAGYEYCDVTNPGQKVIYRPYEYQTTIVTEFSLVCGEQYKIALSGTFYMIGLLIGSFVGGPPADHWGRKPILFFFLITGGKALHIKMLLLCSPHICKIAHFYLCPQQV